MDRKNVSRIGRGHDDHGANDAQDSPCDRALAQIRDTARQAVDRRQKSGHDPQVQPSFSITLSGIS